MKMIYFSLPPAGESRSEGGYNFSHHLILSPRGEEIMVFIF
jgi:hypothetical protein